MHLINWRFNITLSHRGPSNRRSQTTNIAKIIIAVPSTERSVALEDTRPTASVQEEEKHKQYGQYGEKHRTNFVTVTPTIDTIKYFTINRTHSFRIERIVCILVVIRMVLLGRHC